MKGVRVLFLASWVILFVVLTATALVSALSLWRAYTAPQDNIAHGYTLEQVRATGGEDAVKAVRGRRATAATAALGYALLGLFVVLVPYRRGERWAWWAVLVSLGLSQGLSLLRAPMLGMTQGIQAPITLLVLMLLALLAGAPRFFRRETVATVE
jgi:membrane-associated PAP2 superfamily phosphatase